VNRRVVGLIVLMASASAGCATQLPPANGSAATDPFGYLLDSGGQPVLDTDGQPIRPLEFGFSYNEDGTISRDTVRQTMRASALETQREGVKGSVVAAICDTAARLGRLLESPVEITVRSGSVQQVRMLLAAADRPSVLEVLDRLPPQQQPTARVVQGVLADPRLVSLGRDYYVELRAAAGTPDEVMILARTAIADTGTSGEPAAARTARNGSLFRYRAVAAPAGVEYVPVQDEPGRAGRDVALPALAVYGQPREDARLVIPGPTVHVLAEQNGESVIAPYDLSTPAHVRTGMILDAQFKQGGEGKLAVLSVLSVAFDHDNTSSNRGGGSPGGMAHATTVVAVVTEDVTVVGAPGWEKTLKAGSFIEISGRKIRRIGQGVVISVDPYAVIEEVYSAGAVDEGKSHRKFDTDRLVRDMTSLLQSKAKKMHLGSLEGQDVYVSAVRISELRNASVGRGALSLCNKLGFGLVDDHDQLIPDQTIAVRAAKNGEVIATLHYPADGKVTVHQGLKTYSYENGTLTPRPNTDPP
jgi:hypothetical protein